MLHEPAAPVGKDPSAPAKSRLGVWMFAAYASVYALFVVINLLSPTTMERQVVLGLNFATVYGFGLIIVALLQALVYNHLCGKLEQSHGSATGKGAGQWS